MPTTRRTLWREPPQPPDRTPAARAAILDTETTGLSRRDEILEIAVLLVVYDPHTGELSKRLDQYDGTREPGVPIHPMATRTHGIRASDVRGTRLDDRRLLTLLDAADVIVAHNAAFDARFVRAHLPQLPARAWLCSQRGITWRAKGFPSARLDELATCCGLKMDRSHRALADVTTLERLLRTRDPGSGQPYSCELLRLRGKP